MRHARVIFLAVGTPPRRNGEADLSAVEEAARAVGLHMDGPKVVVVKSTVPVGTAERVKALIAESASDRFAVVSNPEFLKEGAAVQDFMRPDRVILGGDDAEAIALLRALYAPFMRREDRVLVMDARSAELTKYAANAMLTEWNEYRFPDFERMRELLRKAVLFDGRNVWSRSLVEALGFTYHGIGT